MDFFKSVFSEDPEPEQSDPNKTTQPSSSSSSQSESPNQNVQQNQNQETQLHEPDPSPKSPSTTTDNAWSFGGLIKTLKASSVIQTYKRDLEEFSTGLKNETVAIREAASRAVKELPVSIEVGASKAQGSLESVGQVIDGFGSSVWRGTTEIIAHGKDVILSGDLENEGSVDNNNQQQNFRNSKRYSRFEANVYAIQNDLSTYSEEPDDLDEFRKWKLGFDLEEKGEEIENLLDENGVMDGIYSKMVPSVIDNETFWVRYFYKIYKLKQAEDARANLVKRVISVEEEDLSWDVDDDEGHEANVSETRVDSSEMKELEKIETKESGNENKPVEEVKVENSGVVVAGKIEDKDVVVETKCENESEDKEMLEEKVGESEANIDKAVTESDEKEAVTKSNEKVVVEGKTESAKSSDFSVISSQPSVPEEEEDLGWDEIEDVGSSDEKKVTVSGGSPNRADLRKRLSTADEDEDLSWDIEEDDEPVKH